MQLVFLSSLSVPLSFWILVSVENLFHSIPWEKTPLIYYYYYYYIRGAFTIDSSTPTLRRILNEHPISIGSFHHKKDIFGRTFLKSL
jgi:hypothetical protein